MNYNQQFEQITRELFDKIIKANPETGTYIGWHDQDHLLSDPHRDRIFEELTFFEEALEKITPIPRGALNKDNAIDRDLLNHLYRINEFTLKEVRQWEKNPDAINAFASIIFLQFTRDYAPLEKRMGDIIERLDKLPVYLERFKSRITAPVFLWTELAIESTDSFPSFLDTILTETKPLLPSNQHQQLAQTISRTKKVCADFLDWLKSLLPRSSRDFALGKDKFDHLLQLREIGRGDTYLDADEILNLGELYLKKLKEEQKILADRILPNQPPDVLTRKIKADHPTSFSAALTFYQKTMEQTRKFVLEKNIAAIPSGEELSIIETPGFMQHLIPFAAYFSPAHFDRKQTGIYLVTPPTDDNNLEEHCYASIANTTVHEGYPGHHLQFLWANQNPSLIRILSGLSDTSHELVEGWAHYAEEMMQEYGYKNSPEARYIKNSDEIWRAVRIIIDVKLSSGEIDFDQAVTLLEQETLMPRESAIREVQRYTQSPGYQLSYLIGKHLIMEMREKLKKDLKEKYSDYLFHNTILKAGSIPISYVNRTFELPS